MTSRRVFAVLAVLLVMGVACSGEEVELPEAPRASSAAAASSGSTGSEPLDQASASGGMGSSEYARTSRLLATARRASIAGTLPARGAGRPRPQRAVWETQKGVPQMGSRPQGLPLRLSAAQRGASPSPWAPR